MKNIQLNEKEIIALRIAISDGDGCTVCDSMIDENGNDLDDNEYYNNCGACWYKEELSHIQNKLSKL